jgi:membrane-bound lytic murein transglycosylase MltF
MSCVEHWRRFSTNSVFRGADSIPSATFMLVTVRCEITLTQTETQKVLYHTDKFIFRNEYEISTDVRSFFEEQDPALDRLAKDFAQRLVAAITENF